MGTKVMGLIMAGGKGERLYPFTRDRAKPAVPFGGKYRIVDFVLSNFVNSGIRSLYVLTQFKSQSLSEHIRETWRLGSVLRDQFVTLVPAQMQQGESWYLGTADAVRQNLNLIRQSDPDIVAVFGADHVYRMDVGQMVDFHLRRKADITVAALPVPRAEARGFGIIQTHRDGRVRGFQEKPTRPTPIPGSPGMAYASMGNYLFSTAALDRILMGTARARARMDFGTDILPRVHRSMRVFAYDFNRNAIPGMKKGELNCYWRDVGTIEAYFQANMELRSVSPPLNLYNHQWPIITTDPNAPPVKFVFNDEERRGFAVDSVLSSGTIVSGARVFDSVIGRNVFIHSWAEVRDSILMDGVDIGRHCRIRRAIIDKNVRIPAGTVIGYNEAADRRRYTLSDSGIVLIPKEPKRVRIREMSR